MNGRPRRQARGNRLDGLGGWTHARIRYAPLASPNQPTLELIARYKRDAYLDDPSGAGFEVLAACTNPNEKHVAERDYAPSGAGVAGTWAIITGMATYPTQYPSLAAYLDDSTAIPKVRVGGFQPPLVPVPNHPGQFMQDTRWVAMLRDIAPRR